MAPRKPVTANWWDLAPSNSERTAYRQVPTDQAQEKNGLTNSMTIDLMLDTMGKDHPCHCIREFKTMCNTISEQLGEKWTESGYTKIELTNTTKFLDALETIQFGSDWVAASIDNLSDQRVKTPIPRPMHYVHVDQGNITIITHERAEALRESRLEVSFEGGLTIVKNQDKDSISDDQKKALQALMGKTDPIKEINQEIKKAQATDEANMMKWAKTMCGIELTDARIRGSDQRRLSIQLNDDNFKNALCGLEMDTTTIKPQVKVDIDEWFNPDSHSKNPNIEENKEKVKQFMADQLSRIWPELPKITDENEIYKDYITSLFANHFIVSNDGGFTLTGNCCNKESLQPALDAMAAKALKGDHFLPKDTDNKKKLYLAGGMYELQPKAMIYAVLFLKNREYQLRTTDQIKEAFLTNVQSNLNRICGEVLKIKGSDMHNERKSKLKLELNALGVTDDMWDIIWNNISEYGGDLYGWQIKKNLVNSVGGLENKLRELLSSDQLSNLIQKKAQQDQRNERKAATFLLGMFSANENRPPEPINIAQCAQAFVTEFNNPSKHTSIETFLTAQIQEIKAIAHPETANEGGEQKSNPLFNNLVLEWRTTNRGNLLMGLKNRLKNSLREQCDFLTFQAQLNKHNVQRVLGNQPPWLDVGDFSPNFKAFDWETHAVNTQALLEAHLDEAPLVILKNHENELTLSLSENVLTTDAVVNALEKDIKAINTNIKESQNQGTLDPLQRFEKITELSNITA